MEVNLCVLIRIYVQNDRHTPVAWRVLSGDLSPSLDAGGRGAKREGDAVAAESWRGCCPVHEERRPVWRRQDNL